MSYTYVQTDARSFVISLQCCIVHEIFRVLKIPVTYAASESGIRLRALSFQEASHAKKRKCCCTVCYLVRYISADKSNIFRWKHTSYGDISLLRCKQNCLEQDRAREAICPFTRYLRYENYEIKIDLSPYLLSSLSLSLFISLREVSHVS